MPGPKLVALSLGGIALTAGTAVLTASNVTPDTAALAATGRALMVGIPFAVGLYAWRRGLRERFGVLLMLMAVLAALTTLAESGNDVAYSSGRVAGWVFEVGLVYLVLSFPTGRLSARVDRWLVGVTAGVVARAVSAHGAADRVLPRARLPTAAVTAIAPQRLLPARLGAGRGGFPGAPVRESLTVLLFVAITLRLIQRIRGRARRCAGPSRPCWWSRPSGSRHSRWRSRSGRRARDRPCSTPSSGSSRSRSR